MAKRKKLLIDKRFLVDEATNRRNPSNGILFNNAVDIFEEINEGIENGVINVSDNYELEGLLNDKVDKAGDVMTGQLTTPSLTVGDGVNVDLITLNKNQSGSVRLNIINEHNSGYQTIRFTDNSGPIAAIYNNPSNRFTIQNAKSGGTLAIQVTDDSDTTRNGIFIDKNANVKLNESLQINTSPVITEILTDIATGSLDTNIPTSKSVVDYVTTSVEELDSYTNSTPVPQNIGGVEAGDTFVDESIDSMLTRILYPYQYPAFTSFELNSFQASRYEVGTEISGSQEFIWSTSNDTNINTDSVEISGKFINTTSNLSNDGSETIMFTNTLTRGTAGTESWTITGTNSKSQTFTRNNSIRWDFLMYYGSSTQTSLTEAQIKSLQNSNLTAGNNGTTGQFTFDAIGYKYFVIADDNAYTKPSSFVDVDTGFAVGMYQRYGNTENGYSYDLVSVTNVNGISQTYRVYRTQNQLTAAININIT